MAHLSSISASQMRNKLPTLNSKLSEIQEVKNQQEMYMYESCFDGNQIKRRKNKQAEWHQKAISILEGAEKM